VVVSSVLPFDLSSAVDSPEGRNAMPDAPEERARANLLKSSKAKCRVLHLGPVLGAIPDIATD